MQNIDTINEIIKNNLSVMLYFSAPTCNVCHALKPKLTQAIEKEFDKMDIISIDTSVDQEVAAHFSVFAIPTVLVFLDGKEFVRKSRHMSVDALIDEIKRPYQIMNS